MTVYLCDKFKFYISSEIQPGRPTDIPNLLWKITKDADINENEALKVEKKDKRIITIVDLCIVPCCPRNHN